MLSAFFSRYFSRRSTARRLLIPVLTCALLLAGLNTQDFPIPDFLQEEYIPVSAQNYEIYYDSSLLAQKDFDDFTEELFRAQVTGSNLDLHYLLANPASVGIEDYEVSLGSADPQTIAGSFIGQRETLKDLQAFAREDLTPEQRLTYDVLSSYLTTALSAETMPLYTELLAPTTGLQVELPILLAEYSFHDLRDVDDYLTLLSDIPRYFDTILELEKTKSEAGLFMCDALAERIANDCLTFISQPDSLFLAEVFEEKLTALPALGEAACQEYLTRHEEILQNAVIPAYQKLADGLTSLMGTGRYDGGLCQKPDGKEYYSYLVRSSTGSSKGVDEIRHRIAEQMVNDMSEMSTLLAEHPELSDKLSEFSFTLTEPEEILENLQQKITDDFPALPVENTAPTVRYVHPSLEESSSPAFYLTCPMDNLTNNVIYINRSSLTSSASRLYAVLAHEGYPGHLYQTVYSSSQYRNPVRHILGFPGFTEGWASYVEQLSYDWGESNDPTLAQLVRLNSSLGLAISSFLDIAIHYDGYSLEDTAKFLKDYLPVDEDTAAELYYEILGNPANYLKYYVGYLEILDLRDYSRELMGDTFSLKDFHQALLSIGEAPYDVIREYLPDYLG